MRRVEIDFETVCSFGSLRRAAALASRGKRSRASVARFLFNLEPELLLLESELRDGSYRPRPPQQFAIRDPKPRTITVAHFRDRVVHHALCAQLGPVLESLSIPWSYACYKGRGPLAALDRAVHLIRSNRYFLKVDVRRFFESIDHGVLLRSIRRAVQGPRVLRLIDTIVGSPTPGFAAGKGLPIGNLTSQHFANFYLTGLDWYILRTIRPRGYVRYMDDLLLVDDDRSLLKGALRQIDAFLRQLEQQRAQLPLRQSQQERSGQAQQQPRVPAREHGATDVVRVAGSPPRGGRPAGARAVQVPVQAPASGPKRRSPGPVSAAAKRPLAPAPAPARALPGPRRARRPAAC
ncbi:MAG: reverse transcriptase domain-containing protein [Candidatus Methanospirare jalkutatii]|nr:reverse transcriptase domain-containing protein [Candidatus Methanospirare jalkutatii]